MRKFGKIEKAFDLYDNSSEEIKNMVITFMDIGSYRPLAEGMEKIVEHHSDLVIKLRGLLKDNAKYYDDKKMQPIVSYKEYESYIDSLREVCDEIDTLSDDTYYMPVEDINKALLFIPKENRSKCKDIKFFIYMAEQIIENFENEIYNGEDAE